MNTDETDHETDNLNEGDRSRVDTKLVRENCCWSEPAASIGVHETWVQHEFAALEQLLYVSMWWPVSLI